MIKSHLQIKQVNCLSSPLYFLLFSYTSSIATPNAEK